MKNLLWFATVAVLISGCATQGVNTAAYEKRNPIAVKNEIQVSEPHSQVWDKLVRELSKSYFVINNIDKESRIINLSFSSKTPTDFVDCGNSHRTYKQGEKTEVFDYETAGRATFKYATPKQEHPAFVNYILVNRDPSLEGRTNVYLAPLEKDATKTLVAVNTRYVLTVALKAQGYAEHVSGNTFTRGYPDTSMSTVSFTTNKPGDSTAETAGNNFTCFSKGILERDILKIVE